jgi:isoaspartyl peptidase/L-asparaginase-like protein (Ntn-hydrolase superfamily)
VTAAITVLEDAPQFNAGRGAVFTHDGRNELDTSLMDGASGKAGAAAGLHRVKNPILLARAIMDKSKHVMMVGDGAETFAKEQGIALVDPAYFRVEKRWQQLQKALDEEKKAQASNTPLELPGKAYFGTVGALALDAQGRLAGGTSTGGMTNKRYGRVGDSPIIGAGTWADDRCAVSGTGWGEFYIRAPPPTRSARACAWPATRSPAPRIASSTATSPRPVATAARSRSARTAAWRFRSTPAACTAAGSAATACRIRAPASIRRQPEHQLA